MPTRINKLDNEGIEALYDICLAIYLDGECYAFATALHEGLGWPIVGLMDGTEIRHALALSPDGILHDARGPISSEQEVGEPFCISPPHELREVTIVELQREGEPAEARLHSVTRARKIAEVLWPELPWKDSAAERAREFCNELEALCRKHKLWISSPYPAAKPLVVTGLDDEGGYEVCPTASGLMFTIDRYFDQ